MPELSNAAVKALAYWGVIEYAANNRFTTADLWNALRDEAERLGLSSPGVTVRGVAQLYGLAVANQSAARRLERQRDQFAVTANLIGHYPTERPLTEQNALGMWQVRFQHTTLTETGEFTEWRTVMFRGALPATVGDLRDAVEADANELAADYGTEHVGIDSLQVLAL